MSTTEVAAEAAQPTPEAATPVLDSGLLTDAQMAEIFGTPETPAADKPAIDATPETPQAEAAKSPEAAEGLDLTLLDEPDKDEPAKAVTPASTPESEYLKKVQAILPNEETLNWAIDSFQRTSRAYQSSQAGNVGAVLEAFPFLKPVFQKAITDYVKTNESQIIEDFVRKNSPENHNPEIDALKERIAGFENMLAAGVKQQQTAAQQKAEQDQQAAQAQSIKAVDTEIASLLDKVRFTKNEADRRIVTRSVKAALAENPEAFQKVISGNLAAMKPVLKAVMADFTATDKAKARPAQDKKLPTPILTGAGSAESGTEGLDMWQRIANEVGNIGRRKG